MKKYILVFSLVISQMCVAQVQDAKIDTNIDVIINNDGTWSYAKANTTENTVILEDYTKWVNPTTDILKDVSNETFSIHKFIYINNGLKKPVSVKLLWKFGLKIPKISLKTINLIILQTTLKSKSFPKTTETYVPIGFFIIRTKKGQLGNWEVHSKFRGDTVYGKIGQFDKFLYFDNEGKLLGSQ